MKNYIKILLFTMCFSFLNAQPNNIATKQLESEKATEQKKVNLSESEAYKLLYENAKEANQQMISTMQWVVGLSIAFLLAILGSQIFFNWRVNKKDIDYIKKDLEEKLAELKSQLVKDLAGTSKEQEEKINKVFEKLEKDFGGKLKTEFDKIKNFLDLREEMSTLKITSVKSQLENEVKALQVDIEKNAGDIWKVKGVEANALSSYLKTALLEMELEHEIKFILDDIIAILSNLTEIHESEYNKLEKITGELKATHKAQKEKIIALYKDKPIYQYMPSENKFGLGGMLGLSRKKYVKNEPKS